MDIPNLQIREVHLHPLTKDAHMSLPHQRSMSSDEFIPKKSELCMLGMAFGGSVVPLGLMSITKLAGGFQIFLDVFF